MRVQLQDMCIGGRYGFRGPHMFTVSGNVKVRSKAMIVRYVKNTCIARAKP